MPQSKAIQILWFENSIHLIHSVVFIYRTPKSACKMTTSACKMTRGLQYPGSYDIYISHLYKPV